MGGIIGLRVWIFASMVAVGQLGTYLQIGMVVFLGARTPLTLFSLSFPFPSLLYPLHPTPIQRLPLSTWCSQEGPFPETPSRVEKL